MSIEFQFFLEKIFLFYVCTEFNIKSCKLLLFDNSLTIEQYINVNYCIV